MGALCGAPKLCLGTRPSPASIIYHLPSGASVSLLQNRERSARSEAVKSRCGHAMGEGPGLEKLRKAPRAPAPS